ncbi:MAG: hypothetical protein ACXAC5_02280 [Promethearchaeota archaeon]|jgi:hypothetical protein
MSSLVKQDGSKAYNWPTRKTIERDADELARRFIASCNHLTPAKQAELDNLLRAMPKPEREHKSESESEPETETDTPDPKVLDQLNAPDNAYSWMDDEPSNDDLDAIAKQQEAERANR